MSSGSFETESSRLSAWLLEVGSWKLTEQSKKINRGIKRHKGEQRKEREISDSTVGWRWKVLQTDWVVFISNAASASTSANTARTNVSDTAEPAHQGERQDSEEYEQQQEQNEQEEDEEVDMDNCVIVRHIFIMEQLALMIYYFVLCTGVVHCSGAVTHSMGVYVHHYWGYQQCVFFTCVKSCLSLPQSRINVFIHPGKSNNLHRLLFS